MPELQPLPSSGASTWAFPCELTAVRGMVQAARQYLAAQGCDENEVMDCELALVEACNNAIQYAPASARQTPVVLEARCDAQAIELRVRDHTPGFDWPRQASLPSPESEHGRGLYLIQALMDDASYSRGSGENILVLRRKRGRKG